MRGIGGWTLRARLVGAVIALLAVVCVGVGAVTVAGLRTYLIDQLDERLAAAGGRAAGGFQGQGPRPGQGNPQGSPQGNPLGPGQAAGTLFAELSGGALTDGGWVDANGTQQELP